MTAILFLRVIIYFCIYFKYNLLLSTFTQVAFFGATSTSTWVDLFGATSTFTQVENKSTCYSSAYRDGLMWRCQWRRSIQNLTLTRPSTSRASAPTQHASSWNRRSGQRTSLCDGGDPLAIRLSPHREQDGLPRRRARKHCNVHYY